MAGRGYDVIKLAINSRWIWMISYIAFRDHPLYLAGRFSYTISIDPLSVILPLSSLHRLPQTENIFISNYSNNIIPSSFGLWSGVKLLEPNHPCPLSE
jgi:hypothetical protein